MLLTNTQAWCCVYNEWLPLPALLNPMYHPDYMLRQVPRGDSSDRLAVHPDTYREDSVWCLSILPKQMVWNRLYCLLLLVHTHSLPGAALGSLGQMSLCCKIPYVSGYVHICRLTHATPLLLLGTGPQPPITFGFSTCTPSARPFGPLSLPTVTQFCRSQWIPCNMSRWLSSHSALGCVELRCCMLSASACTA